LNGFPGRIERTVPACGPNGEVFMNQRAAFARVALLFGALAWALPQQALASGPPRPLSELKLLDLPQGQVFDNRDHLAGAIDLAGTSSVQVNGLRVWGLSTSTAFRGSLIDSTYTDKVQVGLRWEIAGLRDLISVTKASEAAQFGRSTGGAIKIFSKIGSDTLDPITQNRLGQIATPQKLLMQVTPTVTADIAEYSMQAGGTSPVVYSVRNDTLTRVAAAGEAVPGRPGSTFTYFAPQRGESSEFLFFGGNSPFGLSRVAFSAVYRHRRDTAATVPVLENDPATNPYGFINAVAYENARLAIGADKGLLLTDLEGTAPSNIVPARSSYAPGLTISTIREIRIAGERIAFTSIVQGRTAGFVTDLDGVFTKIADVQTPVPGRSDTFGAVQQIGISDDLIAFIGFDSSFAQAGLFGYVGDSLFRIAGPGDVKDGKTVRIVDFMPDAIDHNVLAYTAYFADGSSAAYLVAVVPEPAQWLLLVAGIVLVLGCTRARRRWRAA
jgi:hypothetical protein